MAAYFLLFGVVCLWATNFPAGKFMLGAVGPLTLIAIRTVVGAVLLTLMGWKSQPDWWAELRKDLKSTAVMTLTGVIGAGTLFYIGLKTTSASNAGIIAASTPMWVALFSWAFLKEQLSLINVSGILLSFVGLVSIICQGSLAILFDLSLNWGDLYILLGQLSWSSYTVYSRVALAQRSAAAATASSYIAGTFILVPLCLIEAPFSAGFDFSPLVLIALCYLSVLSPMTNLLYYQALTRVSPHRAAVFMNLIPVIVMISSVIFLGEEITRVQILGTACVIGGVVLTTKQ